MWAGRARAGHPGVVFACLLLGGCDRTTAPAACENPARPLSAAVGFDANSDGVVDVADGAWVLARSFRGGDDPPCLAAVEAYDDVRDAVTGYSIWYALIAGTAVPELEAGACPAPGGSTDIPATGTATCGDGLALSISAPSAATGPSGGKASFSAEVRLVSPSLPVEAWSLSVVASGCHVEGLSVTGPAADLRDDPPGARDGGVAMAEVSTARGGVSLVVLDPIGGATIRPATPTAVLTLELSADVGTACSTCVLSLIDGQVGRGRALGNVVSSAGRSYAPETTGAAVEVCPGAT